MEKFQVNQIVLKGILPSNPIEISDDFYLITFSEFKVVIRKSLYGSLATDAEVSLAICQCHIPYLFLKPGHDSLNCFYAIYEEKDLSIGESLLKKELKNPTPKDDEMKDSDRENIANFINTKLKLMCSPGPCMVRKVFPLNDSSNEFEEFSWNGFYYMPLVTNYGHFFFYRHEFKRNDWYTAFDKDNEFYAGSLETIITYITDLRIFICRDVKLIQIEPTTGGNGDNDDLIGIPKFPLNKI